MTTPLITDREKLRDAEQRIRDALVALADWLTDRDGYDIPVAVIRELCPDDVPGARQDSCFEDLLRVVVKRGPDRTDLPFEGQEDLDYMTGARR
jgi:hypothetical protein